ncbi:prenyltransferase/squalene oxidase repeat-containing protein [Methanobacterium ferruginis]|uniref:prenyltransferase/squalene oxidase repeat-containing protein n=1 Tax=Methanobacterium ferruginis TaxID=710191 RepID=UPI0025731275|nr:prenyltransferase/squalene oxidase repeat-containing protein [Methanobacterium ferruginis]BDZ68079.1 hypothetical protein GCM10025860_15270 [Methanobacterium ferruginis]
MALNEAGIDVDRLLKVKDWILASQELNGGWGWIPFCTPPDSDDTALSIMALDKYASSPETKSAMEKGSVWLIKRQLKNGSISTFPEDYNGYIQGGKIPSTSVTARALKSFLITDHINEADHAKKFLLEIFLNRNYDGPEWFQGILYPMYLAMDALIESNINRKMFKDFLDELVSIQNKDGSWGITVEGGCVEETAFAVTAIILGGADHLSRPIQKAVNYILNRQNSEGDWNPSALGFLPPIRYENRIWTLSSIIKAFSLILKNIEKKSLNEKFDLNTKTHH